MLLRRRLVALAVVAAAVGGLVVALVAGSGSTPTSSAPGQGAPATHGHGGGRPSKAAVTTTMAPPRPSAPYAVGLTVIPLVDGTRTVRLASGAVVPRRIETSVRYPAVGPAGSGGTDHSGAQPVRAAGRFPLIVFGPGFNEFPALYAPLLRAWARAGFVVAALTFPLTNPNAPGGANESDLPNQPADMRLVISRMLAGSKAKSGVLSGLIAPHEIAVAGQSDGGDTALAVAYDPRFRDARVGAAMILSGAEIPYLTAFQIQPGGPPLLATQGTADTINPPSATTTFYDSAPAPKYLLELVGASHLLPYSTPGPQLSSVGRVTIAFLDHYLVRPTGSLRQLLTAGKVPGVATLNADP